MILILCGKSGSGKDAIQRKLIGVGFKPIISVTTRPPRAKEVDGIDYHFVSTDRFIQMVENGDMIEYRSYTTLVDGKPDVWYYGARKQILDPLVNYVVVLDIEGSQEFIKYYGLKNCFTCYVDVPDDIRRSRAVRRGSFDETEWNRRLEADKSDFSNEVLYMCVDMRVDNTGSISDSVLTILTEMNKYKKAVKI